MLCVHQLLSSCCFFALGGGMGWLIEHLMWQYSLIEKFIISGFLGCGLFRKECEVFLPHPPRTTAGASSPGGHRGLGLVFQLGNGSSLTCGGGALTSGTWEGGGDHEHPHVAEVEIQLKHTQPPASQDGKTWYEDGHEGEAGGKTTKWSVVGKGLCERAAQQSDWRSSAHRQKGSAPNTSCKEQSPTLSPLNEDQLPHFYKTRLLACLSGDFFFFLSFIFKPSEPTDGYHPNMILNAHQL